MSLPESSPAAQRHCLLSEQSLILAGVGKEGGPWELCPVVRPCSSPWVTGDTQCGYCMFHTCQNAVLDSLFPQKTMVQALCLLRSVATQGLGVGAQALGGLSLQPVPSRHTRDTAPPSRWLWGGHTAQGAGPGAGERRSSPVPSCSAV